MDNTRHLLRLLAVAACLGCSEPSDDNDGTCPSGLGEFAVGGCAILTGQVVDTTGDSLTGITVLFRGIRECNCTEFGFDVDARGRFSHTVFRLGPDSSGDTVSVMVYGVATGEEYPQPTPTTFFRDSAVALLTFSPVGAVPDTTTVEIRLGLP